MATASSLKTGNKGTGNKGVGIPRAVLVLKGHGFSRAEDAAKTLWGFSPKIAESTGMFATYLLGLECES
jgi:hypothetical protein